MLSKIKIEGVMTSKSIKKTKFLYEGPYSCVYYPSPTCNRVIDTIKKTETIDAVGKIILPKQGVYEWNYAKKLYRIDPLQKYFIYPLEMCEIKIQEKLRKCKQFEKNKVYNILKIPHEKLSLIDTLVKRKDKITLTEFLPKLYHLIDGLSKLHKAKILHHDIKYNNILFSNGEYKWIDFGNSIAYKDIFNTAKNGYLYVDYIIHPPEYRYFSRYYYIDKGIENAKVFAENEWYLLHYIITPLSIKNIEIYRHFNTFEQYQEYINELFLQLKNKNKQDIEQLFTSQASKIDIYAVGNMLIHIYPYIQTEPNEQTTQFYNLIKHMIHPNILQRYDIIQCKEYIQKMLKVL